MKMLQTRLRMRMKNSRKKLPTFLEFLPMVTESNFKFKATRDRELMSSATTLAKGDYHIIMVVKFLKITIIVIIIFKNCRSNRQYRLEEKLKDGTVKGQYGYYDARGKLRSIKYVAKPSEGYQEQHHSSPEILDNDEKEKERKEI